MCVYVVSTRAIYILFGWLVGWLVVCFCKKLNPPIFVDLQNQICGGKLWSVCVDKIATDGLACMLSFLVLKSWETVYGVTKARIISMRCTPIIILLYSVNQLISVVIEFIMKRDPISNKTTTYADPWASRARGERDYQFVVVETGSNIQDYVVRRPMGTEKERSPIITPSFFFSKTTFDSQDPSLSLVLLTTGSILVLVKCSPRHVHNSFNKRTRSRNHQEPCRG